MFVFVHVLRTKNGHYSVDDEEGILDSLLSRTSPSEAVVTYTEQRKRSMKIYASSAPIKENRRRICCIVDNAIGHHIQTTCVVAVLYSICRPAV